MTEEYQPTVALDFDGVLANYQGWVDGLHIGDPNPEAVKLAHMLRDADIKVLVFTCRTNKAFEDEYDYDKVAQNIRDWLKRHGLGFVELHTGYGKPFATAYVDDRAVYFPKNEGNAEEVFMAIEALLDVDGDGPLAGKEDLE